MFNETMLALGKKRSCIRELFEYGLRQAQVVGKENVYDYSLGNPSIPAPPEVNETFIRVIREMDSLAVHSYTPAPGAYDARKAVADELNERFGTAIRPENIFFTCGENRPQEGSFVKVRITDCLGIDPVGEMEKV